MKMIHKGRDTVLIAVLMASASGFAHAAAHHAKSDAAILAAQQAEIDALKKQVEILNQRLNAQDEAQKKSTSEAVQAETQAQTAVAQTRVIEQQAKAVAAALPGQVATAVAAATPKPKPSWADNTTVGGTVFADFTSISQKTNGARVAPSGEGFDIKRAYLIFDHQFNSVFSADLTTDAQYSSAISATELFVKKAYLQARLSDALVVSAGSNILPWAPFVENLYGFRFLEKTLIDRTSFGATTDWGLHAGGKLSDGLISYQVSAINGSGFKNPSRASSLDLEGRVSATYAGFTAGVGGYSGDLGKAVQGAPAIHTATRFNAVAAYVQPGYRLGVEYFQAKNWTQVQSKTEDSADGYSAFGSVQITPKFGLFGRYDLVKPNKDTSPSKKDEYFNLGLSYALLKQVDLALAYKRELVSGGTFTSAAGALGATTGLKSGAYDELGVWTQIKY